MAEQDSFAELMTRLRAGEQEAARQVFQRFAQRLIALAGSRLDPMTRRKLDPEDVLQSVYRTFFVRYALGQFELDNWDSLWGLLTLITVRKCGKWAAHFHAGVRQVEQEVTPATSESGTSSWEALAREPTPEEAAMLAETVEQLLRGLDGREREMVTLRLQGFSLTEISAEVARTERTVQRVLERARKRLERLRAE